jgi:ectoine hydroxylase-related dioxygenase (phytanoyl-CoA dioxygenase family)
MTTAQYTIPPIADDVPDFVDSTPLLSDPAALRARADVDGVLFFRNMFPKDKVLALRSKFVKIIRDLGWLAPGTSDEDAFAGRTGVWEGMPDYPPAFEAFQSLPEFHALAHTPSIIAMFDTLFGEKTLVHPRNIGRIILPDAPPTSPHQDYLYIRGAIQTWTAWLPLGPAPRDIGGVAVRAGSHKYGYLPSRPMPGAGGSGVEEQHQRGQWQTIDYQTGDVVVFQSYTIHRGMPNKHGKKVRLSCDFRYQPLSHEVDKRSLVPHMGRFPWEHYNANWPAEYSWLKDYWKSMPLNVVDSFAKVGLPGY